MPSPIEFGIVGAGWRTEFFMRVAAACPARFTVSGVVVRNPDKASAFAAAWDVATYGTPAEMLSATSPLFVVSCVSSGANHEVPMELVTAGMPVLTETPTGRSIENMNELWACVQKHGGKVQTAEQVHLRPHIQAQMAVARSGRIGTVSQAQICVAHGYHGISVMRRFLGVTFEDVTISARGFSEPVVRGEGRGDFPDAEEIVQADQTLAIFDYGDRLGVFEFASHAYYRAFTRHERVLVRGERGEILNDQVNYLKDYRTPMQLQLQRVSDGACSDLHEPSLRGISGGGEWLYRNPFLPARLMDDEVAVAECLVRMAEYVQGGAEFYSLAEGCQDQYLSLLMAESEQTGEAVRAEPQVWAPA